MGTKAASKMLMKLTTGFPSLFTRVTSQEYPANNKTLDNGGPLFWAFLNVPFIITKSEDNQGENSRITNTVHNFPSVNSRNHKK